MNDTFTIGVLALQGAFREHRQILESLGVHTREVRLPKHLEGISGLIIPGGESTTIGKLMVQWELLKPVRELARAGTPIWGTCAGAIMLATDVVERGNPMDQPTLGLLDIEVERNAFGRQVDSFEEYLSITGLGMDAPYCAVFIRAPLFSRVPPQVEILSMVNEQPVFVRKDHIWAMSFHPELTKDTRLHEAFVQLARSCS